MGSENASRPCSPTAARPLKPGKSATPPSHQPEHSPGESTPRIRLLYSKSKVYVYRSLEATGHMCGYLALVEQAFGAWYLVWTPEAAVPPEDKKNYASIELHPDFLSGYEEGRYTANDAPALPTNEDHGSPTSSTSAQNHCLTVSIPSMPTDARQMAPGHESTSVSVHSPEAYAFCLPLADIVSLIIHPPSLTQWYGSVIINVADGPDYGQAKGSAISRPSRRLAEVRESKPNDGHFSSNAIPEATAPYPSTYSFPPLWFHDDESWSTVSGATGRHWGGDELLIWLRKLVQVERDVHDPNLYYINPSSNHYPLQPTNETSRVALSKNGGGSGDADIPEVSTANEPLMPHVGIGHLPPMATMNPVMASIKGLRWSVLERFSRVTKLYRDTSANVLEHPLGRPLVPLLPTALVSHVEVPRNAQDLCNDYESARLYLAKWAASHILRQEEESQGATGPARLLQPNTSVWQEWAAEQSACGEFQVLSNTAIPPLVRSNQPLTVERWIDLFEHGTDSSEYRLGQLKWTAKDIQKAIFSGGVDHDIRPQVWKFLLRFYPWDSDEAARLAIRQEREAKYYEIKAQWLHNAQERLTPDFQEQQHRIEKDVLRTDRTVPLFATSDTVAWNLEPQSSDSADSEGTGLPGTNANLEIMKDILMTYHYHNHELGYVQGMSDLLAPIYAVMQDEVEAFWCFTHFMEDMERNFLRDQTGMHHQLQTLRDLVQFMLPSFYQFLATRDADNMFCCFRWLLVWFKREFAFHDILMLWEVLWSHYPIRDFHYFVALAILDQHAEVIVENLHTFDEILKYINDLSMTINVFSTLRRAEVLYHRFRQQAQFFAAHAPVSGSPTATDAASGLPGTLQSLLG
ncbi:GTPase activating protein [Dimargaris verticillata]|uniref:GTPase-activating protein GYP7 n=1 Tax=Dimargaris verticillata TaxID=2761393 RepID=A0A9W8B1G5_9FUNG|nr:GTPase activating protein [Dimargaris verticillata]